MLLAVVLSFAAAARPVGPRRPSGERRPPHPPLGVRAALCDLDQDAVPLLRRLAVKSLEVDVRIGLYAAAGAIRARHWGPIKAFGPGAAVMSTTGSGYWFNRVRFSLDGKQAIVAGGALIRYDLATGKEVGRVMEVGGARPGLAVCPDGKNVLTGHHNDRTFHLADIMTLKAVVAFKGHTGGVPWVALSPDGQLVASASADRTARIWDAKTGKELRRCVDFVGPALCLAFSQNGQEVFLATHGGAWPTYSFQVYDVATGKHLRRLFTTAVTPTSLVCHPDGKTMLTSTGDGFLLRLRLADGKEVMRLRHGGQVNQVALAPDGRRALTAGYHGRNVKVWDLDSGTHLETFEEHVGGVLGVDFSPDGKFALSCDAQTTVRLWKVGR